MFKNTIISISAVLMVLIFEILCDDPWKFSKMCNQDHWCNNTYKKWDQMGQMHMMCRRSKCPVDQQCGATVVLCNTDHFRKLFQEELNKRRDSVSEFLDMDSMGAMTYNNELEYKAMCLSGLCDTKWPEEHLLGCRRTLNEAAGFYGYHLEFVFRNYETVEDTELYGMDLDNDKRIIMMIRTMFDVSKIRGSMNAIAFGCARSITNMHRTRKGKFLYRIAGTCVYRLFPKCYFRQPEDTFMLDIDDIIPKPLPVNISKTDGFNRLCGDYTAFGEVSFSEYNGENNLPILKNSKRCVTLTNVEELEEFFESNNLLPKFHKDWVKTGSPEVRLDEYENEYFGLMFDYQNQFIASVTNSLKFIKIISDQLYLVERDVSCRLDQIVADFDKQNLGDLYEQLISNHTYKNYGPQGLASTASLKYASKFMLLFCGLILWIL